MKIIGLRAATLLKNRLWHRCFPVNFAKFFRIPFLQNTSGVTASVLKYSITADLWKVLTWKFHENLFHEVTYSSGPENLNIYAPYYMKSVQIRTRKNSVFGHFSRSAYYNQVNKIGPFQYMSKKMTNGLSCYQFMLLFKRQPYKPLWYLKG